MRRGLRVVNVCTAALLCSAALFLLPANPAAAQTCNPDDPSCPPPPPPPQVKLDCSAVPTRSQKFVPPVAACGRSTLNHQQLINYIDVIPYVTSVSFGMGPTGIEPAGLADLTPEEAQAELNSGGGGFILAAADAAATVATPKLNIWADGKYTWNDSAPSAFDLDGPLYNVMFGADYKLADKLTVGVIGSYEDSNLEGSGAPAPTVSTSGWGIGPYFGVTVTPNIIWSGSFMYTAVETDQNALYHYESDRYQASTALTGYFYKGTWRFSPSVSLAWSREDQVETGGLVADEVIESVMLTPSLQVGNTLRLTDQVTVEPWLGASFDVVMVNRIDDAVFGTILDDPYQDLRLQGGLNFGLGNNAQLAITGEVSGLLLDSSTAYGVEANLAVQF